MCERFYNSQINNSPNYMLDYMSDFPAPTRQHSVDQIYNSIKYTSKRFDAGVSDKFLINLIYKSFDDFNTNNPRGSLSGWHVFECKYIINKVFDELERFITKKRKFKGAVRSMVFLNLIYKDIIEIRYAPNGIGMKTAMNEFHYLSSRSFL